MIKSLKRILEKGSSDQQYLALVHLSEIRSKSAVKILIEFLNSSACEKEYFKKQTIQSIQALLGKRIGYTVESITKWWEKHQNDNEDSIFIKPVNTGEKTGTAIDQRTEAVKMGLKRIPKDKIIVVVSDCLGCERIGKKPPKADHNFDHIERILEKMKIPHTVVKKSGFDKKSYKIDDKLAVIFNCNFIRQHCVAATHVAGSGRAGLRSVECESLDGSRHIDWVNMLSHKGVKKIEDFVAKGGYFFSEDWVLEEVLERAFKGIVSHSKY